MSTTLRDLGIGSNPKYYEPKRLSANYAVGIELEIEGNPTNLDNLNKNLWEVTSDGSLRDGGVEIVAKRGLSGGKLEAALDNLDETLANSSFRLSERCSTHIHLDVTDMTSQQIHNLLCISVAFEHCMFNLFGKGRGSNNFCLTTDCGTDNYNNFVTIMSKGVSLQSTALAYDWPKYAAIGLYRLRDLGTIEYRMFEPMTNNKELTRAVEFLFAMKREAMSIDTPQALIEFKKLNTLGDLFHRLFNQEEFNPETEQELERGIQTLNDILTSVRVVREVEESKRKYEAIIEQAQRQIFTTSRGI